MDRLIVVGIAALFASGCTSTASKSSIAGAPLKCERFIQMVGHSVTFKGLSIPGGDKVYTLAEFSYDQKALQNAEQALLQYDLSHKSLCNLANSYAAGSDRRIEIEDRMVALATGAVASAEALAAAQNKQEADSAIEAAKKDAQEKAVSTTK